MQSTNDNFMDHSLYCLTIFLVTYVVKSNRNTSRIIDRYNQFNPATYLMKVMHLFLMRELISFNLTFEKDQ